MVSMKSNSQLLVDQGNWYKLGFKTLTGLEEMLQINAFLKKSGTFKWKEEEIETKVQNIKECKTVIRKICLAKLKIIRRLSEIRLALK